MYRNYQKVLKQHFFVFRKWSRKGFALFQVMNKVVAISTLGIMYLNSVEAQNEFLPNDTLKTEIDVDLDEIEVSAQRAPVTFSQAARIISVIERVDIEAAPVESIQELLEFVHSVDVRQRGGEGVQADISIRGGSFDQVLILLNGINITDPQTGHHNLNLPVSLNQVQRIEILEGSASRVFGPSAFSGAINIITRSPEKSTVSVNSTLGSFGFKNYGASGSIGNRKTKQFVALNRKTSDGYIQNTDFEATNLFYQIGHSTTTGRLSAQMGYSDKGFGANSFYTPKYPEQYEKIKTYFSSAKYQSNGKAHFSADAYWRHHTDRFELFRNEAPAWYSTHNYHKTNVYGVNVNSWFQTKIGKTAFGLEYRGSKIFSNVLGELLDEPVAVKGADAEYTKSKSRNIYSAFFEHSLYLKKWFFSTGVMANSISGSGLGTNVFPGIDAGYYISEQLKIYSSANKSLRMPTYTDLYYNGPTNVGNPDLKPETATSIEGGLKYNNKVVNAQAAIFHRYAKNSIDWVRLPDEEKWHTENLTDIVSSGVEVKIDVHPRVSFGEDFFIKKISVGYMYTDLTKKPNNYISNYALDNLKHKFDFVLTHSLINSLTATWAVLIQDRNGNYTEFVDGAYGNEVAYKPFVKVDAKLNYNRGVFTWFVSASNLFDTSYFDIGNVAQPGRWLKTGVQVNFAFKD